MSQVDELESVNFWHLCFRKWLKIIVQLSKLLQIGQLIELEYSTYNPWSVYFNWTYKSEQKKVSN